MKDYKNATNDEIGSKISRSLVNLSKQIDKVEEEKRDREKTINIETAKEDKGITVTEFMSTHGRCFETTRKVLEEHYTLLEKCCPECKEAVERREFDIDTDKIIGEIYYPKPDPIGINKKSEKENS